MAEQNEFFVTKFLDNVPFLCYISISNQREKESFEELEKYVFGDMNIKSKSLYLQAFYDGSDKAGKICNRKV